MNKVTMKDIAEAANVSLATVSYVLNNNTKQKISEETRQRILDISKELQYVPNMAARSLVGNTSSKLVAIVTLKNHNDKPWHRSRYHDLTMKLQELLNEQGYDVIVAGTDSVQVELDIILKRKLDALFIMDVPEQHFFNISRKFTVPIIVIDSYIEDKMFRKVVSDYRSAIKRAREIIAARASGSHAGNTSGGMSGKINNNINERTSEGMNEQLAEQEPFLVTGKFNNDGMANAVKESFRPEHVYEMETREGLERYIRARRGNPGIFINEWLAVMAAPYMKAEDMVVIVNSGAEYLLPSGVRRIVYDNEDKARTAIVVMEKLLRKEYDEIEDYNFVGPSIGESAD
ncbi:LacI family DNA-binding transcriptional regulator [Paenibacillus bouchesdurhonensis]|uniref:LacI family DNA-binding transcriptional regulator n=1 Tax=Paenibacillus bouchesdurhonensis TaxID=1870990 RepID=UPI000DA61066|nr:LacI family DNA-binding transcriptional regulator [Paenibacillus bouchesdurhonensis]